MIYQDPAVTLYQGDIREVDLPLVDMVMTSPLETKDATQR